MTSDSNTELTDESTSVEAIKILIILNRVHVHDCVSYYNQKLNCHWLHNRQRGQNLFHLLPGPIDERASTFGLMMQTGWSPCKRIEGSSSTCWKKVFRQPLFEQIRLSSYRNRTLSSKDQ